MKNIKTLRESNRPFVGAKPFAVRTTIDEGLKNAIGEIADAIGRTEADLAREALLLMVETYQKKRAKSKSKS